jgi:hypothetical protein
LIRDALSSFPDRQRQRLGRALSAHRPPGIINPDI